jgi:rhamnulose-1-phosphate aldolase
VEAATYLWQRGWAERNGGNISIHLTDLLEIKELKEDEFRFIEDRRFPETAAGKIFFVTGAGERLRELSIDGKAGCILRFNNDATGYHILWGAKENDNFGPSSEFITHLKIHLDKIASSSMHRVVIHTHPDDLICLSHHPKYAFKEELFTNCCWIMLPEVRAFCPKGIGLVPYTLPGSDILADLSVEALRNKDVVVWGKHGAIASGDDALVAFDFIDVANKGAKLFLKCLASGFQPIGLSIKELKELVKAFKLN